MFQRSLALAKLSWGVLREDRQLVLFPIVSFIALVVTAGSFAVPVFLTRVNGGISAAGWVIIAIGYMVLAFVGMFANAALVVAANERLTSSGPGTFQSGIAGARRHAGKIAGWAVLNATVSVVIRAVEERFGIVGRIIGAVIGIAWSLATYMVVPVLVLEGYGPVDSLKKSGEMLKRTWGENVVGNAGIGLLALGGIVAAVLVGAVGVASHVAAIAVLAVIVAVLMVGATLAITSTLTGIYRVALYRYAVDGQGPAAFGAYDFAGAFRQRRSRR